MTIIFEVKEIEIMIRTIFFYPTVVLPLIFSLLFSFRVDSLNKKGKTKKADMLSYKVTSLWTKVVMKAAGAKITITGLDNIPKDTTLLVMSNHQSYFDIPLLMSTLPFPKGFIAKKELGKWPVIRVWMKRIRCVFMDRDNMRKSAEAIVDGIKILKSGHSMVIFPEGTRSKGGPTNEFKSGSFKLATKSLVPILPVTINGTYNLREVNKKRRIKSASVHLIIHKPIYTANLSKEELIALPKRVEKVIIGGIKK